MEWPLLFRREPSTPSLWDRRETTRLAVYQGSPLDNGLRRPIWLVPQPTGRGFTAISSNLPRACYTNIAVRAHDGAQSPYSWQELRLANNTCVRRLWLESVLWSVTDSIRWSVIGTAWHVKVDWKPSGASHESVMANHAGNFNEPYRHKPINFTQSRNNVLHFTDKYPFFNQIIGGWKSQVQCVEGLRL
jgi:hypothetical protein